MSWPLGVPHMAEMKAKAAYTRLKRSRERRKNVAGVRFGSLVALEDAGYSMKGSRMWRCRCDCGKEREIRLDHLTGALVKSCGALACRVKWRREQR